MIFGESVIGGPSTAVGGKSRPVVFDTAGRSAQDAPAVTSSEHKFSGGSVALRGLPPLGPSDPGGREEALVGSSEVARGCYAPLLDMTPYVKVRNA